MKISGEDLKVVRVKRAAIGYQKIFGIKVTTKLGIKLVGAYKKWTIKIQKLTITQGNGGDSRRKSRD